MTTEIYRGIRTKKGCTVTVNGEPLPPRHDLINHSLNGFEWGYSCSGAEQLSLAILAWHCGSDEQRALDNYYEFKELVISHIPFTHWRMDREYIEHNLKEFERNRTN